MSCLTDENIDFLYRDIKEKGITNAVLLDEMVDHICCSIEPVIERGISFAEAYSDLIKRVDSSVFGKIQHQTQLLTDLKFQKMKKLMFILGFIGALFMFSGVIFKINHWPGAAIGMLLGSLIVIFGFLPLLFYANYKEQEGNKKVILSVIGYLTVSFLILGPLFKIMHWPYADKLLFFGPMFLTLFFLPAYLVQVFKKANETKTNFAYILLIVGIGFSSFMMLSSVRFSKETIDEYESVYQNNRQVAEMFSEKNASLSSLMSDTLMIDSHVVSLNEINAASVDLTTFITGLMAQMVQEANSASSSLTDFGEKENKDACGTIMKMNGNGLVLKTKLADYKSLLQAAAKDQYQRQVVGNLLSFSISEYHVGYITYKKAILIDALAQLSEISKNIEIARYEILNN